MVHCGLTSFVEGTEKQFQHLFVVWILVLLVLIHAFIPQSVSGSGHDFETGFCLSITMVITFAKKMFYYNKFE